MGNNNGDSRGEEVIEMRGRNRSIEGCLMHNVMKEFLSFRVEVAIRFDNEEDDAQVIIVVLCCTVTYVL